MGGGGRSRSPNYGNVAHRHRRSALVDARGDLNALMQPEQVSSRYTAVRVSDFYYGWSAAAADINHDGTMDIVSGPFYLGPSFTERRIYRAIVSPGIEYAPDMVNFLRLTHGWPDIMASDMSVDVDGST
jgi:hypothetical protein